jgi:hypothetical protein
VVINTRKRLLNPDHDYIDAPQQKRSTILRGCVRSVEKHRDKEAVEYETDGSIAKVVSFTSGTTVTANLKNI